MDRFEISVLRGYYGALLTQRQNDMLVMHYDEDDTRAPGFVALA